MKYASFIFAGMLFASCTTGINLDSVEYDHLFNDSNSKVWMVNKVILDGAVISENYDINKHILVFHSNRNCDYIAMKEISRVSPMKGWYLLDSQERTLSIEFADDNVWDFSLEYLREDSILMVPTAKSDYQMSIQLTPFPEL